jgi:two-component system, LytTR family, response regulator
MQLKTVIVDDEAPARERLKSLLADNKSIEVIGEAENGILAVELIEEKHPDLVLLDIEMPRLDGFGVIKMLKEPPLVIFVTAYDEYAIQAFEVNALDYLLKPFNKIRLDKAIDKACSASERKTGIGANLEGLLKTLSA